MTRAQQKLVEVVKQHPRRTAREYGALASRPHPSVRRDLDVLAKLNIVRRCRSLDDPLKWDGQWELISSTSF